MVVGKLRKLSLGYIHKLTIYNVGNYKLRKLRNMQLSCLVDIPTYQHHLSLYQSKVTTPILGGAATSEEQQTNMIGTKSINIICCLNSYPHELINSLTLAGQSHLVKFLSKQ